MKQLFPTITAEHWRIAFNRKENNNIKDKLRNIMNKERELPTSLAGYQCVENGPIKGGDIWVTGGRVMGFADLIGVGVRTYADCGWNIYRKMPVATNLENEESIPRKQRPVASGVLDYFPDAIMAVAHCSYVGNEQHNKGQPLHWDRSKSGDEADALMRHFIERGTMDDDGIAHSAKVAWRALSLLQKEIEKEDK